MKPRCDVAEGPTWHSPRSGLVQPLLYRMQNMERLYLRATPFVATPTARQGSGASMEKTEEAKAGL